MVNPTMKHFKAAMRVVRYLEGSPGKGILFSWNSKVQLLGFSNADWGGCIDTKRSISGYCFFLGHSLVSWKAKKQHTVARCSAEAEYRALASATCKLQWLVYLLRDLHIQCTQPAALYCNNQSALNIATNPIFHEHTKHLDIDCRIVREKSQSGLMRLLPVSSFD